MAGGAGVEAGINAAEEDGEIGGDEVWDGDVVRREKLFARRFDRRLHGRSYADPRTVRVEV